MSEQRPNVFSMNKLAHPRRRSNSTAHARRVARFGQRGATLVEAAIVTPVFFFMIFGVLEFGLAFKDKLTLTNGTTTGARTASAAADDAYADYNVLQNSAKELSAAGKGSVVRIVVFNAGSPDGVPSATCKAGTSVAGTGPGSCNVYTPTSFSAPKANFGCNPAFNLDRFYCPTQRKIAISAATGGPPDYIGVWIQMDHKYFTGFIGNSVTLTGQTIIRIEPRRL